MRHAFFGLIIGLMISMTSLLVACTCSPASGQSSCVSGSSCTDPNIQSLQCGGNLLNLTAQWSNSWNIDNTNPTQDAVIGYRVKVVQKAPSGNLTTPLDTQWINSGMITCNQVYTLTNQTYDTQTALSGAQNCKLPCHIPMPPGSHFLYAVYIFFGHGDGTNMTVDKQIDTDFTDSGC